MQAGYRESGACDPWEFWRSVRLFHDAMRSGASNPAARALATFGPAHSQEVWRRAGETLDGLGAEVLEAWRDAQPGDRWGIGGRLPEGQARQAVWGRWFAWSLEHGGLWRESIGVKVSESEPGPAGGEELVPPPPLDALLAELEDGRLLKWWRRLGKRKLLTIFYRG